MRHLATCFVLCFVASCLAPAWSATAADGKNDKSSSVETPEKTDQEAPEKDKDKKPAKEESAEKTKSKDKKEAEPKKKDDKKEADKKDDKKPTKPTAKKPIHEVKAEPFEVTVALKGIFKAKQMADVSIWPEQWSSYRILKAAKHGQRVKQGELLVAFDPEDIDQAIDDLRRQLELTNIDMRRLTVQIRAMEKLAPMDLAAVERRQRIAKEDYEVFREIDLPLSKEMAKFSMKSAEESLAYAQEELDQLEKMYKADDLTEETEEIVLRRARHEVAQAKMYYKLAKLRYEDSMKYRFPRREESAKDSIARDTLRNKQSKVLLPLSLEKSRLEFEKSKIARERLQKKLKELMADRALMTVKSPADGVVYYGECVNGRWTGFTTASKFQRGSLLPPKKVFMTVVKTRPVVIETSVSESSIRYVREGIKGKATPSAYPTKRLGTIVSEVAAVPDSKNTFETTLMITDQDAAAVMPGMTCTVKLVAYKKKKALTVPPTALGTEKDDDTKHFVHVVDKDGKDKKRKVKVGERTAKAVEILKGLSAGDKILKICPKDNGKPEKK